ncbi:unnamed protein product [Diamesa hyperborea]
MGSQSSKTRTVSFDNDTPSGIIDVSEDVVSRLKSGLAKERANKNAEAREMQPSSQAAPQQIPTIVYQGSPTITSMQVRKEKEAELFANDQYWGNRLKKQESDFLKNNKIMEKEFTDTVNDVKARFQQPSLIHQSPPCQDLKAKIIDCYKQNPAEALKCSSEVQNFLNCINSSRIQTVEAKQQAASAKK